MELSQWIKQNALLSMVILFAVLYLFSGVQEDKKTSPSEWGTTTLGLGAVAIGGVMCFIFPWGGVPILLFGLATSGKGIAGLFTADPMIPWWIWILAFVVIIFIIMSNKKKN